MISRSDQCLHMNFDPNNFHYLTEMYFTTNMTNCPGEILKSLFSRLLDNNTLLHHQEWNLP